MSAAGRLPSVASDLTERLLLGVKQSVNAYNLLRGEWLQRATSGRPISPKIVAPPPLL